MDDEQNAANGPCRSSTAVRAFRAFFCHSQRTLFSIVPKLQAEPNVGLTNSKKGTVDVHRGGILTTPKLNLWFTRAIPDHYQFAFFVRKIDTQNNVLIKVAVLRSSIKFEFRLTGK